MRNFGEIITNSLVTSFENENDSDDDQTPTFNHSKFLEPQQLCEFVKANKHKFSIFNINVDSINQKFPHIVTFLSTLRTKDLFFSVITIQEARIDDDTDCNVYQLPGYHKPETQSKISSEKGGLMTYVHEDYTSTVR